MQNDLINIPYIAHESEVARQERTIKRLWIRKDSRKVRIIGQIHKDHNI